MGHGISFKGKRKLSRREALSTAAKVGIGVVVGGALGGIAGYLAGSTAAPPETVTLTVTSTTEKIKTITQTVTQKVTAPATTEVTSTATTVTTYTPKTEIAGELNIYTPAWGFDGTNEVVKLFQEEYPNVKVNVIRGPSTWDEHVTRTTVWMREKYTGVDVLYEDDVFSLDGAVAGVWERLDDYVPKSIINDFSDLTHHFIELHGGLYRIPWGEGGSCIYYRKDILEEEGQTMPKTWDELVEVGKILTKDLDGDGKIDRYGYVTQGTPGELYNTYNEFLHQAGGDEWTLAPGGAPEPKAKKALEFLVDLELKHKIMPPGITSVGYTESRAMLKEGKAVMLRDWGDVGRIVLTEWKMGDKIAAALFPAGDAGHWAIGHQWGWVVNKYGKNKDIAIEFVLFCLRPEVHKILGYYYQLPCRKSLYEDAEYMEMLARENITNVIADDLRKWFFPRKFPPGHATEYHEVFGRELTPALTGEISVDEALIRVQKAIDPLLPK